MECNILSIDAWRDADGWRWNNWFKVGTVEVDTLPESNRALCRYMRESGFLAPGSAGRIAVEDDGYNVVFMARGTREPLFAIAYGEVI